MTPDDLRKPDACPSCAGNDIRQIMYGLPMDETLRRAERGEVVLGGCAIFDGMPDWHCMTCQHEWFDPSDPARIERDELLAKLDREHREQLKNYQSD